MKLLFRFLITAALLASICGSIAHAGAHANVACRPFRVHRFASLPAPAPHETLNLSEADLINEIAKFKGQSGVRDVFTRWLNTREQPLGPADRKALLSCVLHYTRMDTDGDGQPDWTSIVDGHFSTTLYPDDEDMDGDGIPNVLDPNPLTLTPRDTYRSGEIPAHLKMSGLRGRLQGKLFHRYGLLAIDHSDRHSVVVLKALLELLAKGLPEGFLTRLPNLKFVYASYAHDPEVNIAGYHYQARALSVGGESSYPSEESSPSVRASLLTALAHEMGHVFLLGGVDPGEAQKVASRFGAWRSVLGESRRTSFFDPVFFRPLPATNESWAQLPSRYAATNVHEWFADCFAAFVLRSFTQDATFTGALGHLPPVQVLNRHWLNAAAASKPIFVWFKNKLRFSEDSVPHLLVPSDRSRGMYRPAKESRLDHPKTVYEVVPYSRVSLSGNPLLFAFPGSPADVRQSDFRDSFRSGCNRSSLYPHATPSFVLGQALAVADFAPGLDHDTIRPQTKLSPELKELLPQFESCRYQRRNNAWH